MLFLISNWKLIAIGVAIVVIFSSGWHSHTIYDAYKTNKDKTKIIERLGKGQAEIIKFNTRLDKEMRNAKDDCINKSIPTNVRELLK